MDGEDFFRVVSLMTLTLVLENYGPLLIHDVVPFKSVITSTFTRRQMNLIFNYLANNDGVIQKISDYGFFNNMDNC